MKTFRDKITAVVRKIPCGKTLTYKDVARQAGNEKAARAVGNILNVHYKYCLANNLPTIPCHRVIRTDGQVGGYVLGEKKKRMLLKKEKAI
ncbi:MAG: MGMT family protein [Candidatus Pacebacteria bacterium]|nr:MGMT family protein [Candidatus Paceibacterota bacterium]MDR3583454.1 MGMT family protein [Candidatus Paceibacterota bacterium]